MERAARAGAFIVCGLPFAWLVYGAATGALGPDPAERVMHVTGEWSLRLLALTLLMSPLRAFTGHALPLKLRRMLGLYVFFYASLHFAAFLQLYIGWTARRLAEELVERPYITVGFLAWACLLPLALTSTRAMQRRLRRRWVVLHRLVYPVAILACLHLLWQARSDIGEALVYAAVFGLLLGWRVRRFVAGRASLKHGAG
jgi:sulfoxide reductase heme-binding subunit YedZ